MEGLMTYSQDLCMYFNFALTETFTFNFVHKTQSRCFPKETARKQSHTSFTVITTKSYNFSLVQTAPGVKYQALFLLLFSAHIERKQ